MKNESRQAPASVVDLFCGVGGLAYGFAKAGLRVTAGVDVDESCRYAFEANTGAKFICKSVNDVTPRELSELYSGSGRRIMIGCAPCQPFSSYNRNRTSDPKWFLLNAFMRLVQGTAPHIVSMENVPRLRSHKVFRKFVRRLKDEGYHVWHDSVICSNYGVPQTRRRLVLLASRLGGIDMIGKTHNEPPTVRDAIGDLEHIQAGCSSIKDPVHRSRGLSTANLERIAQTPQGGGWKDWDRRLVLPCHRKKSGRSYRNVYGRMSWDRPSPTITTQAIALGSGRFGHPEQNRALSLREAALIQTFPRGYKFVEKKSDIRMDTVARHIGNAVPVALGKAIALSIKRHVVKHDGRI